jgi:arylsulfatase A-like enzyme
MDVSPTILDYLDIPSIKSDGISLRTFIEGNPVEHDVVCYSTGSREPNYMIRTGNLKLMIAGKAEQESVDALYDLKNDPNEMRNLLVSPVAPELNRNQAEMMKSRLLEWMEKHEPHKVAEIRSRTL